MTIRRTSIAINAGNTGDTSDDSSDDETVSVNWKISTMRHRGARTLTSDTPLSAIVLVDIGNHWSDDKTGDLPTGIESSQSSTGRVVEIFLPGWEGL